MAVRNKEGAQFKAAYPEHLGVMKTPAAAMTHDFRDFLMHKGWPPYMMRLDLGPLQNHGILADPGTLLEAWDWGQEARQYLQRLREQGQVFDLHRNVEEFADAIDRFYEWFWEAYEEAHMQELLDLRRLHEEYKRMVPRTPSLREQLQRARAEAEPDDP